MRRTRGRGRRRVVDPLRRAPRHRPAPAPTRLRNSRTAPSSSLRRSAADADLRRFSNVRWALQADEFVAQPLAFCTHLRGDDVLLRIEQQSHMRLGRVEVATRTEETTELEVRLHAGGVASSAARNALSARSIEPRAAWTRPRTTDVGAVVRQQPVRLRERGGGLADPVRLEQLDRTAELCVDDTPHGRDHVLELGLALVVVPRRPCGATRAARERRRYSRRTASRGTARGVRVRPRDRRRRRSPRTPAAAGRAARPRGRPRRCSVRPAASRRRRCRPARLGRDRRGSDGRRTAPGCGRPTDRPQPMRKRPEISSTRSRSSRSDTSSGS